MNKSSDIIRPYSVENVGGQVGSAETNVTVTVNTNTATRQDYYWYHRLEVDNLYTAAYPQVVVEAVYDPGTNEPYIVSSETGNVFVAASPEEFSYDYDGNLLSDGRFEYQWDAENRLVAATTIEGLPEDVPVVHVEFDYDYQSRRVGKTVHLWDDGVTNWVEQSSASFLYDGWNLVQEVRDEDSEVSTNQFVWGLDLSGSLQGAGGIGGLLSVVKGTNAYFPTFDGNGNVSEYLDASGDIAAHYEFSPFGETIVATGPNAKDFVHRFSTKPAEDNTGLVLYEYRAYSPSMGRFLNPDPIEEWGGLNLYAFCSNNSILLFDLWGLLTCDELKAIRDKNMSRYRQALSDAMDIQNALSSADYWSAGRSTATWTSRLFGMGATGLSGLWYLGVAVSPPSAGATVTLAVSISSIGVTTIATGTTSSGTLLTSSGVLAGRWGASALGYLTGREMVKRIQAMQEALNNAIAAMNSTLSTAKAAQAMIDVDECCK